MAKPTLQADQGGDSELGFRITRIPSSGIQEVRHDRSGKFSEICEHGGSFTDTVVIDRNISSARSSRLDMAEHSYWLQVGGPEWKVLSPES